MKAVWTRLRRPDAAIFCVLFVAVVLLRVPFLIVGPSAGVNNVDETLLSNMVIDRWLYLPAINLAWPAVPMQVIAFLALAPQMVWALLSDGSLLLLARKIAAAYEDPSFVIGTLRMISTIAAGAAALGLFRLALQYSRSAKTAALLALIITTTPMFFQLSVSGTADLVAFAFCTWAAFFALSTPVNARWVGLLTAAAVSTKLSTGLWMLPVFAAAGVDIVKAEGWPRLASKIGEAAFAGVVGWILLNPYLWIAPLNSIKAVVGNVKAHIGGGIPAFEIYTATVPGEAVLAGLLFLAMVAIGFCALIKSRVSILVLGIVLAGLIGFFYAKGFDYPRYLLGASLSYTILAASALAGAQSRFVAAMLAGTLAVVAVLALSDQVRSRIGPDMSRLNAYIESSCAVGDQVWLQDYIIRFQASQLKIPKSTMAEVATYLEGADRTQTMLDWIGAAGVAPAAATALLTDFNTREQVHLARWRARAALSDGAYLCDFHFYRHIPGAGENYDLPGYVRDSLSDKSIAYVKRLLDKPGASGRVHVIGSEEALRKLARPMQSLTSDWFVTTTVQSR